MLRRPCTPLDTLDDDASAAADDMDVQYSLRERSHKFKLSARTSALSDCNFVTRMLFKTKGYR